MIYIRDNIWYAVFHSQMVLNLVHISFENIRRVYKSLITHSECTLSTRSTIFWYKNISVGMILTYQLRSNHHDRTPFGMMGPRLIPRIDIVQLLTDSLTAVRRPSPLNCGAEIENKHEINKGEWTMVHSNFRSILIYCIRIKFGILRILPRKICSVCNPHKWNAIDEHPFYVRRSNGFDARAFFLYWISMLNAEYMLFCSAT